MQLLQQQTKEKKTHFLQIQHFSFLEKKFVKTSQGQYPFKTQK